ncbi:hypothetical protein Gotur_003110 [Gossypium turneri]
MFMRVVATGDKTCSHFKIGRKKSSKQIGRVARLSGQIEKLCNASDNMSQPTCNLTPAMDPYGIPQANYLIACRRKFQKLVRYTFSH